MSILLAIATLGLKLLYLLFRPFPVSNKVVMLSRESDSEPIDFMLLRQALEELSPETEVVSFCRKQTKSTFPTASSCFARCTISQLPVSP